MKFHPVMVTVLTIAMIAVSSSLHVCCSSASFALSSSSPAARVPKTHVDALIAFRDQLECDPAAGVFANWRHDTDPCTDKWEGITCVNGSVYVLEHIAAFTPCSGTLSPRLKEVTTLGSLSLYRTNIHGVLPSEWSELKRLEYIDVSWSKLEGELPSSWGSGAQQPMNIIWLDVSNNMLTGTLPASYGRLRYATSIFLQNNRLCGAVPSEWGMLTSLQALDVSGNCVTVSDDILRNFSKAGVQLADFTPSCFSVAPINTSVRLAGPFLFRTVNDWNPILRKEQQDDDHRLDHNNSAVCMTQSLPGVRQLEVNASTLEAQLIISSDYSFGLMLGPFSFVPTKWSAAAALNFFSSCVTAVYVPRLECFTDATMSTICDPTLQPTPPIWQNKPALVGYLPENFLLFVVRNTPMLHAAVYRVRFDVGFADFRNQTKRTHVNSPPFHAPLCSQNTSVAVPWTTTCAPCPDFGKCYGSTNVGVGEVAAWRVSSDLLPFYPCPRTTKGCQRFVESEDAQILANVSAQASEWLNIEGHYFNNNSSNDNNHSHRMEGPQLKNGSACRAHFTGKLCSRCEDGYGMFASDCVACLSREVQIILMIVGLVVLVVVLTILVYVSLEPEDEDEEDCCATSTPIECCDTLSKKLEALKPLLDRIVVSLRQLINHFSLVGALSSTGAALTMAKSVRSLLAAQQGANTFAFGASFAATLSCLFPGSSDSTLTFTLVWAVFGGAFVLEALVFFVWFRRWSLVLTVALFLGHLAYAPLTENASKLLSLCTSFPFYSAGDYLSMSRKDREQLGTSSASSAAARSGGVAPHIVVRLLSSDHSQDCDDPSFPGYRVGAGLTLAFFSVGLPLAIAGIYVYLTRKEERMMLLHQQQDEPTTMTAPPAANNDGVHIQEQQQQQQQQQQEQQQDGGGGDEDRHQAQTQKQKHKITTTSTHRRDEIMHFLVADYRSSCWYWEPLVVMPRKLAIAVIVGVFPDKSALQIQLFSGVCAALLALSVGLQPLAHPAANRVDQLSLCSAILCAALMSLGAAFPDDETTEVFAAVLIFLSQAVTLVCIIVFGHDSSKDKDNNNNNKNKTQTSRDEEDYLLANDSGGGGGGVAEQQCSYDSAAKLVRNRRNAAGRRKDDDDDDDYGDDVKMSPREEQVEQQPPPQQPWARTKIESNHQSVSMLCAEESLRRSNLEVEQLQQQLELFMSFSCLLKTVVK